MCLSRFFLPVSGARALFLTLTLAAAGGVARPALGALPAPTPPRYTAVDLGPLSALYPPLVGRVNDAGDAVAGAVRREGSQEVAHALLFSGGQATDLTVTGGTTGFAAAVNNSGVIAGYTYAGKNTRAATWTADGAVTYLQSPDPTSSSYA